MEAQKEKNKLVDLEFLRQLIEEGNHGFSWFGNLAIQKLVYLLQEIFHVNLGYKFGLHHLGPYSRDLSSDVGLGEQVGLWNSWDELFSSGKGMGKRFKVTKKKIPESLRNQAVKIWEEAEPRIKLAMKNLRGTQGRELELIATIHYLRNVQKVGEESLVEVLRTLKPKFTEDNVEDGKSKLSELEASAAGITR